MEITWSDLKFGGFVRTYEVTITTSDIALEKFFEKCCPKYFINKDIPPWGIEKNELDTFVHCARVMTDEEYNGYVKGKMPNKTNHSIQVPTKDMFGYCDNYRGFISYKNIIKNN